MNAALAVKDVSFTYHRAGDELFGGLSHEFVGGTVTGVTGPSGRGKSTLLYLLGLMLRPTAGAVLIDNEPVHALSDVSRSRIRATKIGFVFQDAVLDPARTVLDAVVEPALYAGGRRANAIPRARMLLSEFGLEARADHRPGEISGGQAQRVALCRALLNEPTVILADEPTGNLDGDNATAVLTYLRNASRAGRIVIIATHDPLVLECVDHVLALV